MRLALFAALVFALLIDFGFAQTKTHNIVRPGVNLPTARDLEMSDKLWNRILDPLRAQLSGLSSVECLRVAATKCAETETNCLQELKCGETPETPNLLAARKLWLQKLGCDGKCRFVRDKCTQDLQKAC